MTDWADWLLAHLLPPQLGYRQCPGCGQAIRVGYWHQCPGRGQFERQTAA